jgi:hypothetical protein
VEGKCKAVAAEKLHVGCFLHRKRRTCRLKAAGQLRIHSRDRNYNNRPLQPTRGDTLGEFLIVVCVVSVLLPTVDPLITVERYLHLISIVLTQQLNSIK